MTLVTALQKLDPAIVTRACAGEKKALVLLVDVMQRPFYNLHAPTHRTRSVRARNLLVHSRRRWLLAHRRR